MAISIEEPPADPSAGGVGHFAHHLWLKESVISLAENAIPTATATPPAMDINAMSPGDLKTIAEALRDLGIVTQST